MGITKDGVYGTPKTYAWTVDTIPPQVDLDHSNVENPSPHDSAHFSWAVAGGEKVQFSTIHVPNVIDTSNPSEGGTWESYQPSKRLSKVDDYALSGLTDGDHFFGVRGTDAAGNQGS